ncbi:hypothetical protein DL546_000663 [Coniochaeta pulveracea]|uniref:Uncharacterized protein n=1 Tax=Coniochaeta pulveracea TaxID=177199 RepID=A0A420XVY7_9PEZI|nr:hypothetical protein DL546_000663 [Coniochaeta pulveracea]
MHRRYTPANVVEPAPILSRVLTTSQLLPLPWDHGSLPWQTPSHSYRQGHLRSVAVVSATQSLDMSASTGGLQQAASTSEDTTGLGSNRTLAITLSAVLSVVGVVVLMVGLLVCLKCRKRRVRFLSRGVTPVDDDEIATWKAGGDEKAAFAGSGAKVGVSPTPPRDPQEYGHGTHTSTSSIKKPPSVIIYQGRTSQQLPRRSREGSQPSITDTMRDHRGKTSFDKELDTPIQAVAPNARPGLTDETVPGDDPFIQSPTRRPSRLSKAHPSGTSPRSARIHTRTRSSRSSTRSYGGHHRYDSNSDMELSPRTSNDYYSNLHHNSSWSKVYSSPAIPPRLSLDDTIAMGGLSPRPLFSKSEIGRAIG